MMDWWWANMEKGYYLWAPGAHKRFSWVKAPGQVGFLNSAHCISEAMVEGKPVFGGDGVIIHRLGLDWFPFTESLSHVIVEGVFNDRDEFCDCTVHMWEDVPGGVNHLTASVLNSRCSMPPAFVMECPEANPTDEERGIHSEYEASRWPVFLPTPAKLRSKVLECLKRVNAETLIDKRVGALSGGEVQRVLLAMALEPLPNILILDEPMSGVDEAGERQLLDLLDEIRTNYDLSILLSTHDFGTLKRVDKVILLKKQVLVQGPPLLVLSSPEFRAQFPEHGKGGVQG